MTPTLKTIANFRDCGGAATLDGRHLRLGRVYRSGTLDDARGADLRALRDLGLRTIIDLRAPREKKQTRPQVDGARRVDIPIELETRTREKIEPLMTQRGAEPLVVSIMQQMYRDLADEAWPQAGQLFKVLLSAEAYPVLIHCRAGKDRTGFMCALLQQAAGVKHEAIVQDYVETNRHFGRLTPRMVRLLKIFSLGRVQIDNVRASLSACEEYLQAAFEQIEHGHGGLTAYLAKCGVATRELETLRDLLVE